MNNSIIEQPISNNTSLPVSIPYHFYGEMVGLVLVAFGIVAKEIVSRKDKKNEQDKVEQNGIIELLKEELKQKDVEIKEREDKINTLYNELFLTRKSIDFSGDFAPPVTQERVNEINSKLEVK